MTPSPLSLAATPLTVDQLADLLADLQATGAGNEPVEVRLLGRPGPGIPVYGAWGLPNGTVGIVAK